MGKIKETWAVLTRNKYLMEVAEVAMILVAGIILLICISILMYLRG